MSQYEVRGFVIEFDEEYVTCVMLMDEEANIQQTRLFPVYPLFAGMNLFKYKNVLFEMTHEGNSHTIKCLESNDTKIQQTINASIIK